MWYIWRKDDNGIIAEQDRERVREVYGIDREPDMKLTDEKFLEVEGVVRVIDGKITLGRTAQEIEDSNRQEDMQTAQDLQNELRETDYVVIKIAEGAATKEEYKEVLEYREKCREEINRIAEKWNIDTKAFIKMVIADMEKEEEEEIAGGGDKE